MGLSRGRWISAPALLALLAVAGTARAADQGRFDPAPAWPLCGRISEDPPKKRWKPSRGCPAERFGDPAYHDGPISSTFGPRLLVSEGYRYDFHRGLDLATPIGTPIFAVADGVVRKAGSDPSYTDPLIQLRHYRPGHAGSCSGGGGCYTTNYLHVSDWVVGVGDTVVKGQLIGYTGASSASGFEHLHFEVRDAPPQDPFSAWQRDAVHPLTFLPYPDSGAANIALTLDGADLADPLHPLLAATVAMPVGVELDLERVEAEVLERQPDGSWQRVPQPGDTRVGSTIEGDGYAVEPPWWSMETFNRQYSYKNSASIPWASFLEGGVYESPYWAELPGSYDPNVHLDAQDPADYQVGLFNGASLSPIHYNASSSEYRLTVGFEALVGGPVAGDLCLRVRALDVHGNATPWIASGCGAPAISSTPPVTAVEGESYSYAATATGDPPLTWSLDGGPGGMTADPDTGVVSWPAPLAGDHPVDLRVTNGAGFDLQSWLLAVEPASGGSCGDGVCGAGESCDGRGGTTACADCPGLTKGRPSGRFCWVEGVCEGPGC
jgi:murein DD-endopeptidase MepM/ murein hydrolase activator NlpD